MIVCASCGGQNESGAAFCGDCGAFLEWAGSPEADSDPAQAVPAEAVPAEAVPAGDVADVAEAPAPAAEAVTTADGVRTPAAVRPGEAVRRRTRPAAAPVPAPADGETACPGCGAGNDPTRRFCRSCGARLAAPATRRRSWWRRWFGWMFGRRTYAAGTRRRVRRPRRIPRKLVALALAAGLAAVVAGPGREYATGAVDRLRQEVSDQITRPAPVTPTGWEASSALPDHGPDQLSTRVTDQFWAPDGDPQGAWVEAELPRPVRLLHVLIHGGQSTDPELFQQQARPHQVEVIAIAEDGTTTSTELVVRDEPGEQRFPVAADDVVRVRFVFHSVHGLTPDRYLAVGEIEFFARG